MNDEADEAHEVARDVHVEVTLSIKSQLTHEQLKEIGEEGNDISTDELVAQHLQSNLENDDSNLLALMDEDGFIISKCTIAVRMPGE